MHHLPSKPWFAPKRVGYGTGLPVRWQGWVTFAFYLAVAIGAIPLCGVGAGLAVMAVATLGFGLLCAGKTAGGWRWRGRDA